jgi:hypothetical protein
VDSHHFAPRCGLRLPTWPPRQRCRRLCFGHLGFTRLRFGRWGHGSLAGGLPWKLRGMGWDGCFCCDWSMVQAVFDTSNFEHDLNKYCVSTSRLGWFNYVQLLQIQIPNFLAMLLNCMFTPGPWFAESVVHTRPFLTKHFLQSPVGVLVIHWVDGPSRVG